jgi:membrane-associated phospholipid phosphatase
MANIYFSNFQQSFDEYFLNYKLRCISMINSHGPHKLNIVTIIITLTALLVMGLAITHTIGRNELTYIINGAHTPTLDFLFKYLTHAGDGMFAIAIGLYWMFAVNKREAYYIFVIYGISSLITQALKRTVFTDSYRPLKALGSDGLHLIDGVTVSLHHSFPSGHATTIFAIAIAFALLINRPIISILFIVIAALVAYSRVYLLQHFATDVIAGSFIGSVTAIVVFMFMRNSNSQADEIDSLDMKI